MLSLSSVGKGGIQTFFLYNPELYLPSCFFLILYILSIFQNIPLSFALYADRNSLLQGVQYIDLYFAHCCCKISFIFVYLKCDDDLILNI